MSAGLPRIVRPLDIPLVLAALSIGASAWFMDSAHDGPAEKAVVVTVSGNIITRWKLPQGDVSRRDTVEGALGPVVIESNREGVSVVSSSCTRGWCMDSGELTGTTGGIICAPNALLITLVGGSRSDRKPGAVDGVSQ